jgi:hypothetical protein
MHTFGALCSCPAAGALAFEPARMATSKAKGTWTYDTRDIERVEGET